MRDTNNIKSYANFDSFNYPIMNLENELDDGNFGFADFDPTNSPIMNLDLKSKGKGGFKNPSMV